MPEYDYPEMIHGDDNDQFTYFYHWNTNYIIWINFWYDTKFKILIMKENDEIFDELEVDTGIT